MVGERSDAEGSDAEGRDGGERSDAEGRDGGEWKRCRGMGWRRVEGMAARYGMAASGAMPKDGMVGERSEQCLGEARLWLAPHS